METTEQGINELASRVVRLLGEGQRPMVIQPKARVREGRVTDILGQTYPLNTSQRTALQDDMNRMSLFETYLCLRMADLIDKLLIPEEQAEPWWSAFQAKCHRFKDVNLADIIHLHRLIFKLNLSPPVGIENFEELDSPFPAFVLTTGRRLEKRIFHQFENEHQWRYVDCDLSIADLPKTQQLKSAFESDEPIQYLTAWMYVRDYLSFMHSDKHGGVGKRFPRFFDAIWPCFATNDALLLRHQVGLQALTMWNMVVDEEPESFAQLRAFSRAVASQLQAGEFSNKP